MESCTLGGIRVRFEVSAGIQAVISNISWSILAKELRQLNQSNPYEFDQRPEDKGVLIQ